MSFLTSISTLILTNKIDIIGFINVIIIRVLDVITVINFFIKNAVLNVNVLDFSSYSAR